MWYAMSRDRRGGQNGKRREEYMIRIRYGGEKSGNGEEQKGRTNKAAALSEYTELGVRRGV